jgi:2-dehydro-3-deoxyphosphogluconate aldolase / (4S)-4-hydroxy-2-oxoglutarate aldolase
MKRTMSTTIENKIAESGIIAVLVIKQSDHAVKLAKVLLNSGITAMELTLRTVEALEALKSITTSVPDMLAGAGTVLDPQQIIGVKNAGADFAVSPGCNPKVIDAASDINLPFAPGISTPSDIESALSKDCKILKFFHAEAMGGLKYLQAINSPYAFKKLKYIPLGGLNSKNMRTYLEAPEVIALGGSWIATTSLIENQEWDQIARNADSAVQILREVRG